MLIIVFYILNSYFYYKIFVFNYCVFKIIYIFVPKRKVINVMTKRCDDLLLKNKLEEFINYISQDIVSGVVPGKYHSYTTIFY